MNGYNDLYQAVRELTDKPLTVVNTHGHPDHIYGNMFFQEAYLHPADRELARMFVEDPEYRKMLEERKKTFPPFRDILPGDVIDLGGRTLEVFGLPGHTPGGILLLLREDRILLRKRILVETKAIPTSAIPANQITRAISPAISERRLPLI
jgi:glyoxylase-like metal-dependent hydrolase (beta-lactamase superfamily II)